MQNHQKPLARKIREIRQRRHQRQAEFAASVGVSQSTVSRWEQGVQDPDYEQVIALARLAGESIEAFIHDDRENGLAALQVVSVIGAAEEGVWRAAQLFRGHETYEAWFPKSEDYGAVERFGIEVRGHAMNAVFCDGAILECIAFNDIAEAPQAGDYVVVRRRHSEGQLIEVSVRQVDRDGSGRLWLWPRSTHPEHQQPIPMDAPGVDVWALVLGSYNRYRRARHSHG